MQKAEQYKRPLQNQPAARQGGRAVASAQGERIAQLEALAESSPQMEKQGLLAAKINTSPAMTAQRKLGEAINNSPRMVAQHDKLQSLSGGAAQLKGAEDELLQGKFKTVQRVEEEEPLQGKFEAVQRVEEEEPLQGKFETMQRVEEEEPLQGKFETLQRVEEEEPLQGKFEAVQRLEEEEPLQGKFSPDASVQRKEPATQPNDTGLPDTLKSGVENLSGMSMDHVKVHYNSSQPAQLNALAYAQGSEIHVAPGQEQHLPHEAWHIVQQAQGRVRPTMQMKDGVPVNDDRGLEHEADVMGAKSIENSVVQNKKLGATSISSGTAQLWPWSKKTEETPTPEAPTAKTPTPETAEEDSEFAPGLTREEMLKKAGTVAGGVSAAGTVASGTMGAVTAIEKSITPDLAAGSIFSGANTVFDNIKDTVVGLGAGLIAPIANAGLSILGMKEKWSQWGVYKAAAVEEKNGETVPKADAPVEATYGLTKAPSGFIRYVKDFFMNIVKFTTNLLLVIPGGQIAGAPMKAFTAVADALGSLYSAGKRWYQHLRGEKKDVHSASLLDKAIKHDDVALKLILDLKLGSITGSGYAFLDMIKKWGFDKVSSAKVGFLNKVGVSAEKAEKIIDKMKPGSGGPSTIEELHSMLLLVCDNAASKELIRAEIKETMTGIGV